jgi:transcriptional regulator GlxA family with amidase domain
MDLSVRPHAICGVMFLALNLTLSAKLCMFVWMSTPSTTVSIPRFNFLLQPEFPLNALILASDALRIANQNSGRDLFRWCYVTETGGPVRASNQMWLDADHALDDMPRADVYLLFEGNLPTQNMSRRLLGRLREAGRFGAIVGGVDTGAFALATAGLAATEVDRDIVLHWEAEAAFAEEFPAAHPLNQIYRVSGNRVHCAGGVATLDMMLDLIARFHGGPLANEVANALVHTRRPDTTPQRDDMAQPAESARLASRMVALMERNLDFPLSLEELAAELGVPQRSLTRVSRRGFGESPMRLYLHIRLQAARNFLFYEEYSIKDVAVACGFSYPAVFSRAFKAQYGQTPRTFRSVIRARQNEGVRPELRRLISSSAQAQRSAGPGLS